MKRLVVALLAAALVAAAVSALAMAAKTETSANEPETAAPAAKRALPPLPAEVRQRRRWRIGVKCDTPPFGYIDPDGRNAGLDVEIGRWFARFAFGRSNRVTFECVTTASRIPALEAKRVDIIIATITWFPSRAQQIDFSTPYYAETGRLLVRRGTNLTLQQLAGKTITTTGGSIYDSWLQTCFRQTTRLTFQGTANPLLALKDGRADAFMYDAGFLLEYAQRDPDVRLTNQVFARAPWGIGIRKGETAMRRWINARLNLLRQRDQFVKILRNHTTPALYRIVRTNVPRPKKALRYPNARTQEEMLPCLR